MFATVWHRTVRTKRALFKLAQATAKTWRRLKGANQLPRVIEGGKFTDGVATQDADNRAA